jgi:ribosome-associated protein
MIDHLYSDEPQKPTKSENKREMHALQKLGESLLTLNARQLEALNLPPDLLKAIVQDKNIPGGKAKRRHHQFIGRLMRQVDEETLTRIKRFS